MWIDLIKKQAYSVRRRSKKWWHRIFYFCIDLAVANSFTLYQIHHKRIDDQITFLVNLAKQLIKEFSAAKSSAKTSQFSKKRKSVVESLEDVGNHMPDVSSSRRRCHFCSTKNDQKRTNVICIECQVPLCIDSCF